MLFRLSLFLISLLSLFHFSTLAVEAASQYTITPITQNGQNTISATDINNSGQVSGITNVQGPNETTLQRTLIWKSGITIMLPANQDITIAGARRINDSGIVVGWTQKEGDDQHAVKWENQQLIDFGTVNPPSNSVFKGINSAGVMIGDVAKGRSTTPIMFKDGFLQLVSATTGTANAINDSNVIIGESSFSTPNGNQLQAVIWNNGQPQSLGTLPGGSDSRATSINNSSQIVGYSTTLINGQENQTNHAYLWQNGQMQDLGALLSQGEFSISIAEDINNDGQIVGRSVYNEEPAYHATLWENGQMHDLNSLVTNGGGWVLKEAIAINDMGQIIGYGDFNGVQTPFLLTSTTPPNRAPQVDAGPNLKTQTNKPITLNGSATDDGKPNPPGSLTYSWSKVSGPGTVTFVNIANPHALAIFDKPGKYVLKLTVSDSKLSASDTVTVTVVDHYYVELKAWIPQKTVVDPLMITRFDAPNSSIPTMGEPLKSCFNSAAGSSLLGSSTVQNSQFAGDDHNPYGTISRFAGNSPVLDTSTSDYRVINAIEFDYDGSSILNVKRDGAFGQTKRYVTVRGDSGASINCLQTATEDESVLETPTITAPNAFHVSVKGFNPLMPKTTQDLAGVGQLCRFAPLTCQIILVPAIDGSIDGTIGVDNELRLSYTTDLFPSYGVAVKRNGSQYIKTIVNDARCVNVQGIRGASMLLARLQTTLNLPPNTGPLTANTSNKACDPDARIDFADNIVPAILPLIPFQPLLLIEASHLPN